MNQTGGTPPGKIRPGPDLPGEGTRDPHCGTGMPGCGGLVESLRYTDQTDPILGPDAETAEEGEKVMDEYIKKQDAMIIVKQTCGDYATAFCEIDKLPAADVAPVRHGKWVSDGDGSIYCSECNRRPTLLVQTDYCPKCGAKMDGGEKE